MIAFPALMKLVYLVMAAAHLLGKKPPIVEAPHGPQICVRSYWQEPVWVLHQDTLGNVLPFADAVMRPTGQVMCGRWEFRSRSGRFLYIVRGDTVAGAWIRPWDKSKR